MTTLAVRCPNCASRNLSQTNISFHDPTLQTYYDDGIQTIPKDKMRHKIHQQKTTIQQGPPPKNVSYNCTVCGAKIVVKISCSIPSPATTKEPTPEKEGDWFDKLLA